MSGLKNKTLLILFNLIGFATFSFGQHEYDKWNFGNLASIDFTSGTAVPTSGSAMNMVDCPATVSDSLGNLLFYSNSLQVWNRNNQVMPNGSGISGNLSGGQPANIVRVPCNPNLYLLITNDAYGYSGGLRYSLINMNLNGGLGDVVAGQKNILLLPAATEQLYLTKDANGHDAWLIAHPSNSGSFNVFHITSAGINTTPVVSTIGAYRGTGDDACGQITMDTSGRHIAMAHYLDNSFELYDFNNSTGTISNLMTFTNCNLPWGMEFSADGSKLYVSGWTTQYVDQFDLSTYTQAAISASIVGLGNVTGPGSPYYTGYMQRGPDGKIYIAVYMDTYLAVINSPNTSGTGCNLVDNGFYLGGQTSSAGLPNKVVVTRSVLSVNIGNDTSICTGQFVMLSAGNPGASYLWNTGSTAQSISVDSPGVFWVTVNSGGCTANDSMTITSTTTGQPISLGNDTTLCAGQTLLLDPAYPNSTYKWQDNSTSPTYQVSAKGNYSVTVTNTSGCSASANITVDYTATPPLINLGNGGSFCDDTLLLNARSGIAGYKWSDGSVDSTLTIFSSGTYSVTASNGCGTATGEVDIDLLKDKCALLIPTGFSPNNDGKNDVFRIISRCPVNSFFIRIFNRWGQEVYQSSDITTGWDGTFKERPQPLDVYVYYIEYFNYCKGALDKRTGNITLLR